jgi:hypothetical protein
MAADCLTTWWRVSAGRRAFPGLVVALRIDREFADQLAVFGDHPIVDCEMIRTGYCRKWL